MNKKPMIIKIAIIIILLIVIAVLTYVVINHKSFFPEKKEPVKESPTEEELPPPPPPPKLKIIDLDSKTRPIGIMVDNEGGAWPQAGLQDAFLIYEIIAEGGESRFFALFKDTTTAMIGPARSARHYFIDYALENDAIFTHYGFSPQAQNDLNRLDIDNISGTERDGSAFWREKVITTSWQNCFTSINNLKTRAIKNNYRITSDATPLLNYSIEEVDLSLDTNAKVANTIRINYSKAHYVVYQYDPTLKNYKRYSRGKPQVDRVTNNQYTAKNIIVYGVRNYSLNDEAGKGRQGVDNIGSGDGYYISNGYTIPIKWEKLSRESKTTYKDLNGNEIKVNDGNTFIHLQPNTQTLKIE